jgi:uncharacterized membrane protein YedE/YeeE
MNALIFLFGFLFGAILSYASLNRFNVISGLATRDNFAVPKAIAIAIALGAILLSIENGMGWASFHIKPFIVGGIILGGLLFGAGMAILGYCPGTLAVSLGEGSLDALIGILGGLLAGWIYTLSLPHISTLLGPDLGKTAWSTTLSGSSAYALGVLIFAGLLTAAAFWLHKKEAAKDLKWLYAGIALAVLEVIVFFSGATNRPIGASTTFPYVADVLTNTTDNNYFEKIATPGHWELIFLIGAFLAGLLIALIKKDFRFTLLHDNWKRYKGDSKAGRALWAFVGGFILIFGARMAGGCTSGHILSGGMQMAGSSLVFTLFVFIGILATGKLFYKK